MSSTLTGVAAGAATLALAAGLIAIARRLRTIGETQTPAGLEGGPTGRTSRPLLATLYQDPAPSPWTALSTLPGGPWVALAVVLAIVAIGSASLGSRVAPAVPQLPDSTMTLLQDRVDSLAGLLTHLHDSLRLEVRAESPARPSAPNTRLARRVSPTPAVVPPPPAPPVLSPTQ